MRWHEPKEGIVVKLVCVSVVVEKTPRAAPLLAQ
jgi:hypothetical protein